MGTMTDPDAVWLSIVLPFVPCLLPRCAQVVTRYEPWSEHIGNGTIKILLHHGSPVVQPVDRIERQIENVTILPLELSLV